MAKERLSMRKIKEVLRLHFEQKQFVRQIARSGNIARSTVADYLSRAEQAGLTWPLPPEMDDAALENRLFPPLAQMPPEKRQMPPLEYLHQERKKKGVTRMLLWHEYKQANPDGYQYSQFCERYRQWEKKLDTLQAQGNKPLQMTFEDQLNALIYFHLEEHSSRRHLLQDLEEDDFAREQIAPKEGIKKSRFFEAINNRGLEQLLEVFEALYPKATRVLPRESSNLGDLVGIDGSLIDAVLSMTWADYREGAKKAKVHLGFDLNHSIPS